VAARDADLPAGSACRCASARGAKATRRAIGRCGRPMRRSARRKAHAATSARRSKRDWKRARVRRRVDTHFAVTGRIRLIRATLTGKPSKVFGIIPSATLAPRNMYTIRIAPPESSATPIVCTPAVRDSSKCRSIVAARAVALEDDPCGMF